MTNHIFQIFRCWHLMRKQLVEDWKKMQTVLFVFFLLLMATKIHVINMQTKPDFSHANTLKSFCECYI